MAYEARFNKNGNIKVGNMWTWSKLAGSGMIDGCKGSCGNYCQGCYNPEIPKKSPCYVFSSYNIYPSVRASHIRNTNAIRNDIKKAFSELYLQVKRARNKPSIVRIHASGEIETVQELLEWGKFAEAFPTIPVYIYTKAFDILEIYLKMIDKKVPANFWINCSIWHENGVDFYNKYKDIPNIRCFAYVDKNGYDYESLGLKIDVMCPAYRKNEKGKVKLNHDITCDKCKICFSGKNKVCGCFDH